jgi:hypothetical protein
MNAKHLNSEKGQAIVYLAIGLVVFMGFVALAIDGGMALADRRNVQNAADAASLAGGGRVAEDLDYNHITERNWSCGSFNWLKNNAEVAAYDRALANGFTTTYNLNSDLVGSDNNYAVAKCYNLGNMEKDKYIEITVEISATTPSNFLQLVFPTALHNEVEAATHVYPRHSYALGNAIVALNKELCSDPASQGVILGGNSNIDVDGGGIFSNGCLRDNGGPKIVIIDGGGRGWDLEHITYDNWEPDPEETDEEYIDPLEFDDLVPEWNPSTGLCTDPKAHNKPASELKMSWVKKETVTLSPGLWCIQGDLTINAGDKFYGTDVTIFMVDGKFDVAGTADIQLAAPDEKPDPSPAIPHVVITLPPSNTNVVQLNGNESAFFQGMVLAPKSTITLNGTGYNTYQGQMIGWNVKITGTAGTNVDFDPNNAPTIPTKMELYR